MDYWTYDEYIAFREGVKDKPLSYICFEILYWTGMREGELLALSPADIDLDIKLISINRTYQRIGGKDVFTSPKVSHEMIRSCKNTGVKKIRIHDIRHSHASLLIHQDCDALMLADRLGHEKVSTTLNTNPICSHINNRSLCIVWSHCRQQICQHLNHHLITICLKQQVSPVKCLRLRTTTQM